MSKIEKKLGLLLLFKVLGVGFNFYVHVNHVFGGWWGNAFPIILTPAGGIHPCWTW